MAKLRKTNALLAILFVLVGIGLEKNVEAAGALEWEKAYRSSSAFSVEAINPFDGRGIVMGVILSSGLINTGGFVAIRDSDTATALDGGFGGLFGPVAVVIATNTGGNTNNVTLYHPVMFGNGIRVTRGLSVNALGCPTAGTAICYTVLFNAVSD